MENYTTFLLPQFVDSRMLIVWITVAAVVLFLLLFFIWKINEKRWIANLAGVISLIALALLPVAYFGTPFYNTKMMADSVANDYNVTVSAATDYTNLIVVHEEQALKCAVNSTDSIRYYVLCDVPDGRLLLNDITAGK